MIGAKRVPRWTISILTIPSREAYLAKLLESLSAIRYPSPVQIDVVYNMDTRENPLAVEARLRKLSRKVPVNVHFNAQDSSIAAGRVQQLNMCKSPLICFIDDDITMHGDVFQALEEMLQEKPLGIVGLPSLIDDTRRLFKPRRSTPFVVDGGLRYMPVQGMLVAGYRRLFLDIGGFNTRRRFWGEWTELNLRMWRSGFPTAYVMDGGGFLRHWHDAPESPTRNRAGKAENVLWGLICTALEYEVSTDNDFTRSFWDLVETRYLAYSFGRSPSPRELLSAFLSLTPRIAAEWPNIAAFREEVSRHPFGFMPFHPFTGEEVRDVLRYAEERIGPYRAAVWGERSSSPRRLLRRA